MRTRFHMDPIFSLVLASIGVGCSGSSNGAAAGDHAEAGPSGGGTPSSAANSGGHAASVTSSGGGGGMTSGGSAGVTSSGGTRVTSSGGGGASGFGGVDGGDSGSVPAPDSGNALAIGKCSSPVVVDGGWMKCSEGFLHRATSQACTTTLSKATHGTAPATPSRCDSDAQCGYLPYGHCSRRYKTPAACEAGCVTDADCGEGRTCLCQGDVGECVAAACTTDSDCGAGSLCATYVGINGCSMGVAGVACQKGKDECLGGECATALPGVAFPACQMQDNVRKCLPGVGGCGGRPFLVEGEERMANVVVREDWRDVDVPCVDTTGLSDVDRARATEHFTNMARMEHASIAAFARFSLELLALGAPADLVADAARAMGDEQRHATRCFALASQYAGRNLGPEGLSIDGALTTPTLESVALTTLLEGCIGELVATTDAREAAGVARDAFVRRTLLEIAEDESRHATLAWRFLRWAVEREGASLLARARDAALVELHRARATAEALTLRHERFAKLEAYGILSESVRAHLRAEVIDRVVLPALDALDSVAPRRAKPLQRDRTGAAPRA